MKKLALVMLFMVVGIHAASADEKKAVELLYRDAQPIWMVGAVLDSKGCLWGLTEDHGTPVAIRIVDGRKKQFCRNPK
ncbi:hypothetical protein [Paraburkholderia humisilvae]|uniref:Uncharacterized protein n=1 Tax=Paraburkholderia humisilvae TaxID=627669 RepID=A0A6J5DJ49_9BURK|nr:hypothetical protein [Paraburkholderia humisilvae]CAB3754260.1 hypothetical protein LMG29542_02294 [Paraburkholderia humisilvae]